MNYQRVYDQLMFRAICRTDSPSALIGYSEKHHIVPKCFTNNNKKSNLVKLTAREHYIAHHLLYKIYEKSSDTRKKEQMARAWMAMCYLINDKQSRAQVKSYQYEAAKKAHSEAIKGKRALPIGFTHSDETKLKLSEVGKGRAAWNKGKTMSEDVTLKNKLSHVGQKNPMKGKKHSSDTVLINKNAQLVYQDKIRSIKLANGCDYFEAIKIYHIEKSKNIPSNVVDDSISSDNSPQ